MGPMTTLIDFVLFLFFLLIAVAAPLIDGQTVLPSYLYPEILINLKNWYVREYDDYLVTEKPYFLLGLVWLELLFQWPLSLLCIYAISTGKSWFKTPCLIHGVSTFTSMVAILAELSGSNKASEKLFMVYYPFFGFAILAMLRGLLSHSGKTTGKRSAWHRKKKV